MIFHTHGTSRSMVSSTLNTIESVFNKQRHCSDIQIDFIIIKIARKHQRQKGYRPEATATERDLVTSGYLLGSLGSWHCRPSRTEPDGLRGNQQACFSLVVLWYLYDWRRSGCRDTFWFGPDAGHRGVLDFAPLRVSCVMDKSKIPGSAGCFFDG